MSTVAIVNFGSQVTQLIARRVRELGVYSEVLAPNADLMSLVESGKKIDAFILSGGPGSVGELQELPKVVLDMMTLNARFGIPVLGICYGFQILARYFNMEVTTGSAGEFGKVQLNVVGESAITRGVWSVGDQVNVWMSHSDSVIDSVAGDELLVVARSTCTGTVALMSHEERKVYGLQFHPEVVHTPEGSAILNNFLTISDLQREWSVKSFLYTEIDAIKDKVGDQFVVAAISGGVDSSVAAVLLHRALGEKLRCVFVDTGLLRKAEAEVVRGFFIDKLHMPVTVIDAADLFFRRLRGVVGPEEKRKVIGSTFVEVFEQEARKLGDVKFLMQGTIYPDVIESGVGTSGVKIKSHHNVGGLPEVMNLSLIEPLRSLFKDEVRALGAELGLPSEILYRHPFPGPGLAVRVIGEVTEEKVALLREVDSIYVDKLREKGLYSLIWQAFAVLIPVRTVGVMGDGRTYGYVCALRAVTSTDGMTADCFPFWEKEEEKLRFFEFLQEVSGAIVGNVSGINRVVYDVTSKPPATIEWE